MATHKSLEWQLERINKKLNLLLLYLLEVVPTKQQIRNIMSAISEYKTVVDAQFARINAGLDNVTNDIAGIKAKLEELNNNPGPISAEDQALLDASIAGLTAIGDRAEALAASTEDAPTPAA